MYWNINEITDPEIHEINATMYIGKYIRVMLIPYIFLMIIVSFSLSINHNIVCTNSPKHAIDNSEKE